jgi:SAM-dependent methyltransferase
LRNIEKIKTSGVQEIGPGNWFIDVALLFDVFHVFYFSELEDRRKLLDEIYRIMRPSGFLSVSVWLNLIEPEIANEIKNANFYLEKEVPEVLTKGHKEFGTHTFWNYRKI